MDLYSLFIIVCVILALTITVYLFFKTPKEQRTWEYAISQTNLKVDSEKLKTYDKSKEAVIIKGNKKKAIFKNLPFIIYMIPVTLFTIYLSFVENLLCSFTFGMNNALIILFIAFEVLPFGMFLLSIGWFREGFKIIKTGYFPPLDSVQFFDTIATKSFDSKFRGFVGVLSPFIFLIMWFEMHNSFMSLMKHKPIQIIEEQYQKKCINQSCRNMNFVTLVCTLSKEKYRE